MKHLTRFYSLSKDVASMDARDSSSMLSKRNILVLILLVLVYFGLVRSQYGYHIAYGTCLHGQGIRTVTRATADECFLACVEDCFCMAFQIFHYAVCQLLSTTRFLVPSSLANIPGCIYFDMFPDQKVKNLRYTVRMKEEVFLYR